MNKIELLKPKKIKQENKASAVAEVTKCKFAGTRTIGIGPLAKATHFYKLFLKVEGVDKIVKVKFQEKAGWNAGVAHTVTSITKMFSKNTPVIAGEKFMVEYDKLKPKKCNIVADYVAGATAQPAVASQDTQGAASVQETSASEMQEPPIAQTESEA